MAATGSGHEDFRALRAEPCGGRGGGGHRAAVRHAGAVAAADPAPAGHAPAGAVRQCGVARGGALGARGSHHRADRGSHARPARHGRDAFRIEPRSGRRRADVRGRDRHDPCHAGRRLAPQYSAAASAGRRGAAGVRRRQLAGRKRGIPAGQAAARPLGAGHRRGVPGAHGRSGGAAARAGLRRVASQSGKRPAARGAGELRPASARGARHHPATACTDRHRGAGRVRRLRQRRPAPVHGARDRTRAGRRPRRPGGRLERGSAALPS